MKTRLIGLALLALGSPLAAEMLSPDMGDFKAEGSWTDQDGHLGQWRAEGKLLGGRFAGSLVMEMAGVTRTLTLVPARAALSRGSCVLAGENARNRVELRGTCSDSAIGPGSVSGRIDGHALRGKFEGKLAAGPALTPAPPKAQRR
jgi:hypothetical protein